MATLTRSKSPRPGQPGKQPDKEESFWDKIGTLGRKKRIKEGTFVQEQLVVFLLSALPPTHFVFNCAIHLVAHIWKNLIRCLRCV